MSPFVPVSRLELQAGDYLAGAHACGSLAGDNGSVPTREDAAGGLRGRDGEADWGLAVCDLPAGGRAYAKMLDRDLLADAEREELVGAAVQLVAGDANVNVVKR